jgi:hypothetical protein
MTASMESTSRRTVSPAAVAAVSPAAAAGSVPVSAVSAPRAPQAAA